MTLSDERAMNGNVMYLRTVKLFFFYLSVAHQPFTCHNALRRTVAGNINDTAVTVTNI